MSVDSEDKNVEMPKVNEFKIKLCLWYKKYVTNGSELQINKLDFLMPNVSCFIEKVNDELFSLFQ